MTLSHERALYKVNRFTKDFRSVPKSVQTESWSVIKLLAKNIFDDKLDVKKLVGFKDCWRVKVGKDWRLIFTFDEHSITLLRIAHRKDIYRLTIDG